MAIIPGADEPAVRCNADGGKAFAPAMTPQQICDRFVRVLGDEANHIEASLHFSVRGIASATIRYRRDGEWQALPLFEVTAMDRPFREADIDRLAETVLTGIRF